MRFLAARWELFDGGHSEELVVRSDEHDEVEEDFEKLGENPTGSIVPSVSGGLESLDVELKSDSVSGKSAGSWSS